MSGRKKKRKTGGQGRGQIRGEWARLCRQRRPHIRAWFAKRVAAAQDADDLTEEVLLSLARVDHPEKLDAYITGAMVNALTRYRRRKARERTFLRGLLLEADGGDAGSKSREDDGSVDEIFRALPPAQAQLLRLRFLEGLRVAEVARRVGCSPAAAYKRLQRTIQHLRQKYSGELK